MRRVDVYCDVCVCFMLDKDEYPLKLPAEGGFGEIDMILIVCPRCAQDMRGDPPWLCDGRIRRADKMASSLEALTGRPWTWWRTREMMRDRQFVLKLDLDCDEDGVE